jgi:hypothetical protein
LLAALLPAELAAGPDPAVWRPSDVGLPDWLGDAEGRRRARATEAVVAWSEAGEKWGADHGLRRREWRSSLPADVAYAVSAAGRLRRGEWWLCAAVVAHMS